VNLTLQRESSSEKSTIGILSHEGLFECFTLEDIEREAKIPGKTAIPAGRYRIIIDYSMRFKRLMPLLLDVPGFTGVRIHPGNDAADTEGCILVGRTRDVDFIGESRIAFEELFARLRTILAKDEQVFIEIASAPKAPLEPQKQPEMAIVT